MKNFVKIIHSVTFEAVVVVSMAVSLVLSWMFAAAHMVTAFNVCIFSFLVFFVLSFLPMVIEEKRN